MSAWFIEAVVRRPQASMTLLLVWTCIVLGIGAVAVFAWFAAKKRRAAARERAASVGFAYVSDDPGLVDRLATHGDPFDRGFARRVTNVLTGTWNGRPAIAVDYSYKTHSGRKSSAATTHHLAIVGIKTGMLLPPLSVLPEAVISQATDNLLDNDITVENREFNRTFTVTSDQPNIAVELLDSPMTEFLLFHPHEGLKINGEEVLRLVPGHLRPEHLPSAMHYLDSVVERIPEGARRKLGASDQG